MGKINKSALNKIQPFCESLIKTGESLIAQIGDFNLGTLLELQLLTVGPQFRGSMNNKYGQVATEKTFSIIKDLLKNYILSSTPTSIEIKNDSGRLVANSSLLILTLEKPKKVIKRQSRMDISSL
jgi:hypothetical protein